MLHIFDGESSASTFRETGLPGEVYAWKEALLEGPTPADLDPASWRAVRAEHLAECYGLDRQECEDQLLSQEELLESFVDHDEVVLWFEHDLFCQTNLLYLFNWFSSKDLGDKKLSLNSIDHFPGIEDFRGLGQLNARQLSSLFDRRKPVTVAQLQLGAEVWRLYCSADPTGLENQLAKDLSALPFLRRALELHLARFPATTNGLGRIEQTGLAIVADVAQDFAHVFREFGNREPVYGLGDAQFWAAMHRLSACGEPLILQTGPIRTAESLDPDHFRGTTYQVTETGRLVLRDEDDHVQLNGVERWLGGVHLTRTNVWRWNDAVKKIERS